MNRVLIIIVGVFGFFQCWGQIGNFNFQRSIENPVDQWHRIPLPVEIYGKIQDDFSDLRIYGVSVGQDTLEMPFFVETKTSTASTKPERLKVFNQSTIGQNHFFTFEIKDERELTELELKFRENNFDWRVHLEGSTDLKNWYSISKDNRIVSILNNQVGYTYAKVSFPPSRYQYYRISLPNKTRPVLLYAEVFRAYFSEGEYVEYPIAKMESSHNSKLKTTQVDIHLPFVVPVSYLKVNVNADFDYYRAVKVQYLADSVESPQGLKYLYNTIHNGYLSSFENNEFYSTAKKTNKIRLIIRNEDNQPVEIDQVSLFGNPTDLVVRFGSADSYFLHYGNEKIRAPRYDITSFKNTIPKDLKNLKLGKEISIASTNSDGGFTLFADKIWLWAIMILIIALLGSFTYKMMQDVE